MEKIYISTLDRKLTSKDEESILEGLKLEDGLMKVDDLAFPDPYNRFKVGVTIHSGKNRIVRRIFESLNYEVKQLDRIVYAGLTKKDLPRGKWRMLKPFEISTLKNKGKKTPQISIEEKSSRRKSK